MGPTMPRTTVRRSYSVEFRDDDTVVVHKTGAAPQDNTLVVGGEELHEHQADPPEPAGGGPARDAQ